MEKGKIKIALVFGGRSAEHEVSIRSARNIFLALDKSRYTIFLVYIDRQGVWSVCSEEAIEQADDFSSFLKNQEKQIRQVYLVLGGQGIWRYIDSDDVGFDSDVIFPVLHGPNGEDGSVQGYFELARVPYVGARVLGSAVGMDKDVMKRLLRDAHIPIGKFLAISKNNNVDYQEIVRELGQVIFVKPARLGSSVGVSKVRDEAEFNEALKRAFQYDTKIIIEEYIPGREIECSVLGGQKPKASQPGEVKSSHDFYSYEAKYLDPYGATFAVPADLKSALSVQIQQLAIQTYSVLECDGMARVDFFITPEEKILINEINTIPGFTTISMYPKMWAASGVSYSDLVDNLINLAFKRNEEDLSLKSEY